jgi:hypothetical protein
MSYFELALKLIKEQFEEIQKKAKNEMDKLQR